MKKLLLITALVLGTVSVSTAGLRVSVGWGVPIPYPPAIVFRAPPAYYPPVVVAPPVFGFGYRAPAYSYYPYPWAPRWGYRDHGYYHYYRHGNRDFRHGGRRW